ncbi:MAG: hypothetical protein KIT10_15760 [Flavobacteriales bacterium]|nr:hypothetical protein [Flavobacteriales bacterium]
MRAQQIIVSLNLLPPYSAYVYDYADLSGQAIITLTNTTMDLKEVRLEGSLVNVSAGVFIRTEAGHRGASPILVPPGGTVVLGTQPGVLDFFDPQYVTTNASQSTQQAIVQTGQLPEGLYQLCVEAFDYNGPQLLSQPGGGCFTFGLSYANPPIITQPVHGMELSPYLVNPVFSWTPPLGNLAGALIAYDLLVTPVFEGQNPNDAIIAARNWQIGQPVLRKEGWMSNVYVRQPADLPFEQGKTYAMQVTAKDLNNNVGISNQGRSEISVFTIGMSEVPIIPYVGGGGGGTIIDPGVSPEFLANTLSGKLHYFWHNLTNHGESQGGGGGVGGGVIGDVGIVQVPGMIITDLDGGNRSGFGGFTQSALAGVTVQLIQAVQFQSAPVMSVNADKLLPGNILVSETDQLVVHDQPTLTFPVLATATTDAQGNFHFNVPHVEAIDFGWKQGMVSSTGGWTGEFNQTYTGTFRRVLMVRVGNPARKYYAQPIQFNAVLPANGDLGLFHAQVKSYDVRVVVAEKQDFQLVKPNMEVLLLRKTGSKPSHVPKDEASRGDLAAHETITINLLQYEILAKAVTNSDGLVEFRDLVRFDCATESNNNLYFTWARPTDEFTTQWSLSNLPQPVNYAYQNDWGGSCFNVANNALMTVCTKCLLSLRDGFSTLSRSHARAFKGQDAWLYHVNRTTIKKPAITATVKNQQAGTQANMALAEPLAPWKLWRISNAGMQHLMQGGPAWGASLEGNEPDGFIMLKNALAGAGKPMVLEAFGQTGNDGRIHAQNLSVEGPFSAPQGYFYVLDVEKAGFGRRIKVVNRMNISPGGGTVPAGGLLNLGVFGNFLGGMGGGSSPSGGAPSGGGSTPIPLSMYGDVGMVRPGYQYSAGEIWLSPKGKVRVVLNNEAGQSLGASAHYWDPASGQQGVIVSSSFNWFSNKQEILLDVPSGNGRKIIIIPNNLDLYDRDTITVNVPATGTHVVNAVVPYKLHRIHFTVHGEPQNPMPTLPGQDPGFQGPKLAGARVELIGTNAILYPAIAHPATAAGGPVPASPPGQPLVRSTNNGGMVDFAVKVSGGEPLKFRIYAPDNSGFVTREVEVSSVPGKHWYDKPLELQRGRTVQGHVRIDSAAVAGANVRYTYLGITAEAQTGADGFYSLTNVPKQALTFIASKQGQYVGMEYVEGGVNTNAYGAAIATFDAQQVLQGNVVLNLDFQLSIYDGMDFSRILGFPLEVTAFTELQGGQARINGWVTVPDSANATFRLKQASASGNDLGCVRFEQVVVEPDVLVNQVNVPLVRPVALPMPLSVNEVAIGMYPKAADDDFAYHATLRDTQQGIALERPPGGDQRGAVTGGVQVAVASFTDNNFTMPSGQGIGLAAPTGGMRIPAFASDAQGWYPTAQALRVANTNGQPLAYTLHGFQANSITAGSYLYPDSLVLDTRLHTDLEFIPAPDNDLDLAIGSIKLVEGQLVHFSGPRNFNIPLGQFDLAGSELTMDNSGFAFKGVLNAAGMELAVEQGRLGPTSFSLGEMGVQNMKLMGTIPVDALRPAEFGYDAARPIPAWYVVVTSRDDQVTGATISGAHLDGIPAQRDIAITSIWLFSNGAQEVALRSGIAPYPFHGVSEFHLMSMIISPDLLTLSGELNLGIPGFPTFTTGLLYDKNPGGMSDFSLQPFAMPHVDVNGVQIAFNKGSLKGSHSTPGNSNCLTFEPGKLTIRGVIGDQDPQVFKDLAYTLERTAQLTKLTVDREPQQSMRLGGDNPGSRILMTDVEGEMWVQNGANGPAWNTFYVKGDMPEEMGFETQNGQPQRMRFEVHGDLQVENQQVKLKDIETPFGNINMVYDMQHHRLSGSVNVAHGVSNGPSMSGAAAIVIDRDGFYFMSGLQVNLSDPKITGMAFILLGDYATRTPEMDAMLMQYSLHVQKKMERQVPAYLIPSIQELLVQQPAAGVAIAQAMYPSGDLLPPTYLGLFGSGRFNGFYFNAGAQIPWPMIPTFSIDLSPLASLEMGCEAGIDVRFGANFGSGIYGVGFDTYVDIYMGGGGSIGVLCVHGRIGLYLTVGLDGVFQSNGNYNITGSGAVALTGDMTVGGGLCSIPCDDDLCLHFTIGGTIGLGMQANISNSGSDFVFTMGNNGTSTTQHDPPPTEN